MDVGTLTDYLVPFPAPVDYMGSYDRSFALFGDIQIGTDWNRFHFDAGIQLYRTMYVERETVSLFPNYVDTLKYSFKEQTFGFAFSSYFRVTRTFNIGINYYPSFIVSNHTGTSGHYAHLPFLDLIFRIRIR